MPKKGDRGIGRGGSGRGGSPKSDAERRATHQSRYGNTNLPPRGTGRGKR